MTLAQDVSDILADAHAIQAASIERLDAGDIRDAAEKAWCAMVRVTDALILARTGVAPERLLHTTKGLQTLAVEDKRVGILLERYYIAQSALHVDCFCDESFEPIDYTERLIHGVAGYVADAEALADARP